jgi:hypothetical protein
MRDLLQATWPRGSGAMGCYGSQPIPKSYPVLPRDLNFTAINFGNQIGKAASIFRQLRTAKSSKAVQT